MLQSDMKLDGNAIGGVLREIFVPEMTTANVTCAGCSGVNPIGRGDVYVHAPGLVLRCPACQSVVMRIVHGRGRYWVDLTGARCLELIEP